MLPLPNGCHRSKISVNPKNWATAKASLKKAWKITYRFYDPKYRFTKHWGHQESIKGMNHLHDLADRQEATQALIDFELNRLENEGYNPITGVCTPPVQEVGDLNPNTSLTRALDQAYLRLSCAEGTKDDIRIALVPIKAAIAKLKMQSKAVGEIRIRDAVLILESVGQSKGGWTPSNFNHFRSYLQMLFKIIVPLANMQGNPVDNIPKLKEIKKQKRDLTADERRKISDHLRKADYDFYRFMNIFFHSGSRTTEIMRVKLSDVDLDSQRFLALVKKGRQYEEVWKPIKNVVLPLWQEVVLEAKAVSFDGPVYLFSKGLVPGVTLIKEINVSKRWREKVKQPLKIDFNFYWLKSLNTTETIDYLTEQATQDAAAMNSHKSNAMVVNIYDINRADRQIERLKKVNNPFAK